MNEVLLLLRLRCLRKRVRTLCYATYHFWWMGDSNIQFWGEDGTNP